MFRKRGLLDAESLDSSITVSVDVATVIEELGAQLCGEDKYLSSWVTMVEVPSFLKKLLKLNKGAFQSVVLRTIAVLLDRNYTNHIKHCEYIWVINSLGGKIVKIPTKNIRKNSWQYFAAFRTKEDAIYAIRLLKQIKDIYGK